MKEKENYFEELFNINVNSKVNKRGNFSYLSWSFAWSEAKKRFPDLNRTVYEDLNGRNYFTDNISAWVKVGVTINGIEHIDYLPVMNIRNKSIPVAEITSFDINKAIQRSTVKALALHGLGLYIYEGEDLPEAEALAKAEEEANKKPTLSAERFNKALASVRSGDYLPDDLNNNFELDEDQKEELEALVEELIEEKAKLETDKTDNDEK